MKLKILIALLLFSSFSQAQKHKVFKSCYQKYENGKWVIKKTIYPSEMYVSINSNSIKINNQNESVFIIYGSCEKTIFNSHISYSWNAIDKDADECNIILKQSTEDNSSELSVTYYKINTAFTYIFE